MKPLTVLLAVALGGAPAFAKERDFRIRAIALDPSHPTGEVFCHAPAKTGTPVTPKSFLNHESDKVPVDGLDIVFTTRADAASTSDSAATLGKGKITAKQASAIAVFLAGAADTPSQTILVDDSKTAFPPGSTLVVNVTPFPIRLMLEGKEFRVEPGANNLITKQPVNTDQMTAMKGSFQENGNWEPFTSGLWTHPGSKRVLQIISVNPGTKQPQMKGLRDVAAIP